MEEFLCFIYWYVLADLTFIIIKASRHYTHAHKDRRLAASHASVRAEQAAFFCSGCFSPATNWSFSDKSLTMSKYLCRSHVNCPWSCERDVKHKLFSLFTREVVFIPLLFKKMSYLSVMALGHLVVLMLEEEEECEHLHTQRSLTILYLRLASSRLFC